MKVNVILKENNRDLFSSSEENTFYLDSIFTDPKTSKLQNSIVEHDIYSFLTEKKDFKLCPNNLVADFSNIAMAVYAIDQTCNRDKFGYYGWSRYINLYIPVYNSQKWNSVKEELENTLSFLSGDKWVLNFRNCLEPFPNFLTSAFSPKKVCLFSGGMDSFIGISDLINKNDSLATVSHHKGGNSGELSLQKEITNLFIENNKNKNILPYNFYVQGKKNEILTGEKTQRARSILFLSLASLVANTSSKTASIVIPENGLISLNLPLTPARGGSHSTKTTHPKFISSLNTIFKKVGIQNMIENPYRFLTKGEMLAKVNSNKFVLENITSTLSCSKPGYYQQWTGKSDKSVKKQCGHCVPCIIRRASLYSNGLDNADDYVKNVFNSNEKYDDYNAFNIAIGRYSNLEKIKLAFLKSGYMNISENEIKKYIKMYNRGLKEVRKFILQK
ncbi:MULTISPECIES: Qat anti-phage system QueC-like protein QatC [unclassified Flavobacterium]|uniref:Qat anti-phage system QueC-like protein QatC n=1 Tax=unclassified Flavobacterium TaxID=196869 RepID=UPI0025BAD576|nr:MULTISPECIES: Qat anti-phage system QueC-like protein QatC [unclassified Flavobacterium]